MNNQIPYGFNPMQQPMWPGANYNQFPEVNNSANMLEERIKNLETKVANIEKKLNMSTSDNTGGYNPYMSSMHMM